MKNLIRHIAVAFLVAIISISTMGISINSLYYFCTGASKSPFFHIEYICNQRPSESIVLSEGFRNLPPCCQKTLKKVSHSKHERDCAKKNKKRIKTDLKFLEIKKTELPIFELFASAPSAHFSEMLRIKIDAQNAKLETLPRPSFPEYSGRELLNFIQIYRC